MSVFKSALSYFNESPNTTSQNEFVGQIVELGDVKLRVGKQIGEGGFAFVYVAKDVSGGKHFALKRLLSSDAEIDRTIRQEIAILKLVSGHPNIVKYLAAAAVDRSRSPHGRSEYLVVTELCTGGNMVDVLRVRGGALPPALVCQVMYQTSRAIHHLHSQNPAVLHRDIKIENLLIGDDGLIKLCDFGSATTTSHDIDHSWSSAQRSRVEEEMAQHTTPMYRAPEMLDTWNNHPISTQADLWALGCVLFMLCFGRHPFEDSAKLRIVNGNYHIPDDDTSHRVFHQLIRGMLKVDPRQRLNITAVLDQLVAIGESLAAALKAPLTLAGVRVDVSSPVTVSHPVAGCAKEVAGGRDSPARSSPPRQPLSSSSCSSAAAGAAAAGGAAGGGGGAAAGGGGAAGGGAGPSSAAGLFSSLRGGAGSLLKNLVDTSKTVVQSVQQTMISRELDMSYLSCRLVVMSYPAEGIESTYRNSLDDVRAVLETKHQFNYCVYNLAGRSYNSAKFPQVLESNCGSARCPPLSILYSLCQHIYRYLQRDSHHVAVVHCLDGKACSAAVVCSLLLYTRVFSELEHALNMFAVRRCAPELSPSQSRYVRYIQQMVTRVATPVVPHLQRVTVNSVVMQPVPLFTRARDGCRPYVEVWQGSELVFSSQQDYELFRHFEPSDRKVMVPIGVTVCGDVTVAVYHARRLVGRLTSVRIAQCQFHSGFVDEEETRLRFQLDELDHVTEPDRYPARFQLTVGVLVCEESDASVSSAAVLLPWQRDANLARSPEVLFADRHELQQAQQQFANNCAAVRPPQPPPPPVLAAPSSSSSAAAAAAAGLSVPTDSCDQTVSAAPGPAPAATHLTGGSSASSSCELTSGPPAADLAETVDLLGLSDTPSQPPHSRLTTDPLHHFTTPAEQQQRQEGQGRGVAQCGVDLLVSGIGGTADFDPFGLQLNASGGAAAGAVAGAGGAAAGAGGAAVSSTSTVGAGGPLHLSASASDFRQQSLTRPPPPPAAGGAAAGGGGHGLLMSDWSSQLISGHSSQPNLSSSSSVTAPPPPGSRESFDPLGDWGLVDTPQQQSQSVTRSSADPPSATPATPASPAFQQSTANYGRSVLDPVTARDTGSSGVRARLSEDAFGELLGSQGYSFSSRHDQPAQTIGQMKKAELARETDPDKVKIIDWTEGKRRNIRALLCSLQQVVWPQCRWQGCHMNQLMTPTDVKRVYRRACLAVHPDKQTGTDNEKLAKLIFMELNDAYSEFDNDESQQNLFRH